MASRPLPDITPLIANAESAIRYYGVFALLLFATGLVLAGLTMIPSLGTASELIATTQKIGGGFISTLSTLPLKQIIDFRGKIRILEKIQYLVDQKLLESDFSEEDIARLRQMVWDAYKRGLES